MKRNTDKGFGSAEILAVILITSIITIASIGIYKASQSTHRLKIVQTSKDNPIYSEYTAEEGSYKPTKIIAIPNGLANKRLVTRFYDNDSGILCYMHGQAIHCERMNK